MELKNVIKRVLKGDPNRKILNGYYKRFYKMAFKDGECTNKKQYEASIIRLYHTVEKGLSYENYRPGFGKDNINVLVKSMFEYSKLYDNNAHFYRTALDVLYKYCEKNKQFGYVDVELERKIYSLPGIPNGEGGVLEFRPYDELSICKLNYAEFVASRHSIRHFSRKPVSIEKIEKALQLSKYTPSACNRQGWKTRVIKDKEVMKRVLENQNGNRGFGEEIDTLLLITSDLNYFNYHREVFQAYIDGGMYAMSVINSLHFQCLGTIPLSGSLTPEQEKNVRRILNLDDAEVLILFIGVGNYPEHCQTTKSIRHKAVFEII